MINGIINVYKEKGYTSHDVVAKLRGILGQKKIGHTGTLDPDAQGVLPVCLGRGTKLCDMLTDKDKTYEAVLLFGKTTDTQDVTGTVLKEHETLTLTEESVRRCIHEYIGVYEQLPPMYSALKVNGKKLYELAREGIEVERKKRNVHIYDIQIRRIELPRVSMEVTCSKGTYIRTLCHDIGQDLGVGACMEMLERTKVGRFKKEDSIKLGQIEAFKKAGMLQDYISSIDSMFLELAVVTVSEEFESLAYNGNPLGFNQTEQPLNMEDGQKVRVYDKAGHFIGVYTYLEEMHTFRLDKMFYIAGES